MLTRYGKKELFLSASVCFTFSLVLLILASVFKIYFLNIFSFLTLLLWITLALFFRDPTRKIPQDEFSIVSPADGIVKDIELVDSPFSSQKKFKRIGIFLSVLNVHINRMPADLEVKEVVYKKGCFHDARNSLASKENESNTILCEAECGEYKFPLIVKQISGAIARRIVSEALPGKIFKKGEKFGMIKFGSRTELYLPDQENISITISVGNKVHAGTTVIALANLNKKSQQNEEKL